MQIYAPISFDRSLYVFACNTRACSLQPAGWVIVRNQKQAETISSISLPHEKVTAALPETVTKGSTWDFLSGAGAGDTAAGASAWGDFTFEDEDTSKVDDLEALLKVRDMSLLSKAETTTCAPSNASTANSAADELVYKTEHCLPCTIVSEEEEYWTAADERAAWEGLIDSETGAIGSSSGAGQDHIDRLLASYYEGEEDVEIVNLVKQQGAGGKKGEKTIAEEPTTIEPVTTTTQPTSSKQKTNKALTPASHKGEATEEDDDSEAGFDMKLSRSSRRQQVETYFQSRVSYYPTQVLRYAYGGSPLWITHPSPLDVSAAAPASGTASQAASVTKVVAQSEEVQDTVFELPNTKKNKKNAKSDAASVALQKSDADRNNGSRLIPCCERCGKGRVFECQLMPALLSYIITPAATTTTKCSHSAAAGAPASATAITEGQPSAADLERFRASLGEGVDFGVVAIYSCPDSCDVRTGEFATEVVVVQAPPDIV